MIFQPVLSWLDREPARLVRMEYLLASARYAQEANVRDRARMYFQMAESLLRNILRDQSEEGQAALAVHPWQTTIKKGLEG